MSKNMFPKSYCASANVTLRNLALSFASTFGLNPFSERVDDAPELLPQAASRQKISLPA